MMASMALSARWAGLRSSLENNPEGGLAQVTQVETSLEVIAQAWSRFQGEQGLAFAFNGGKDSTVLLYLLIIALERHLGTEEMALQALSKVRLVYFEGKDEFPQVLEFMERCRTKYTLQIEKLPSDYKLGLGILEAQGIKAVLMGQR
jgi:3'-phosphoadenosine 5'-phosphosulfate sulfotransferase (PAPS reductase)/FAD synthetase